jgi:Protein of unknown function (DUF2505)
VHVRIETVLPITPQSFWTRVFFNAEFGRELHQRLGFLRYAVVAEATRPDGCVERTLETEPPMSGPELVQKRIGRALRVTEHGVFDPRTERYRFTHTPAMAASSTRIEGTIHVEPHARGCVEVIDFDVVVSAFGLGSLIERAIEKTTRDSYAEMGRFTAEYAARHGFVHTP